MGQPQHRLLPTVSVDKRTQMTGVELDLLLPLLQKSMAQGQTFYLTVRSNSMAPLLRTGDQIAVEATTVHELRAGDIVVVNEGLDLLTHRYWGKSEKEKRLITRGDRSLVFDPLWEPERLIGRVTARRRRQQSFVLRHGVGGWLVAHLGRLALLEQRLFASCTEVVVADTLALPDKNVNQKWQHLPGWLLRRALRIWGIAITFLCSLVARANQPQQSANAG